MSRTDKTDPFWVRIRTHYYASDPWHRHGPDDLDKCDLPPLEEWDGTTDCHYMFVWTGRRVCACKMCSGFLDWYTKDSPRIKRHDTKRLTKQWVSDYRANGDIEEWWA